MLTGYLRGAVQNDVDVSEYTQRIGMILTAACSYVISNTGTASMFLCS